MGLKIYLKTHVTGSSTELENWWQEYQNRFEKFDNRTCLILRF